MKNDKIIQVCSECSRACCWYGEFMCDKVEYAGTKFMTIKQLKRLSLENSEYWTDKTLIKIYGEVPKYALPNIGA